MNLDENIPRHAELIARYLNEEMDKAEMTAFEKQFLGIPENDLLVSELKKQWKMAEQYREELTPDPRKAWKKLYERLEEENLLTRVSESKRIASGFILRMAAVALILAGSAVVLYYSLRPGSGPPMENIITGSDAKTLVRTLPDGSVIYLAQNTSFSFPKEFNSAGRNVELKGEAFFDIARDESKPFRIETDEAIIQVLGTAFTVKTKNGSQFELLVERGKVKVTSRSDPSQVSLVIAGEKITSDGHSLVKTLQLPSDSRYWYKNHMHFKDETLQNIILVLNRNFSTNFVVSGKDVGNRRLTVTFSNESVETMTQLLCLPLNLQSQITDGTIQLSPASTGTKGN